jgi:hypothetical protein
VPADRRQSSSLIAARSTQALTQRGASADFSSRHGSLCVDYRRHPRHERALGVVEVAVADLGARDVAADGHGRILTHADDGLDCNPTADNGPIQDVTAQTPHPPNPALASQVRYRATRAVTGARRAHAEDAKFALGF